MEESLLVAGESTHNLDSEEEFFVIIALAMIAALALALVALHGGRRLDNRRAMIMMVVVVLAILAVCVGLLDAQIMLIAAVGSALVNLVNLRAKSRVASKLPIAAKTV